MRVWKVIPLLVALAGAPRGLAAQQGGQGQAGDSAAATAADSARLRIQRRLEALGRPPGIQPSDTIVDTLGVRRSGIAGRGRAPDGPQGPNASDSVLSALRDLEGYTAMSWEGRAADYDARSGELVVRGDSTKPVRIQQPDGTTVTADSLIRYNQETRTGEALGSPTATPAEGDEVVAQRFVFDAGGERASAFGARTRYNQGGGTAWNVTGDLPLVSSSVLYGDHTRFTSCDLEDPHYHFETDELKIVKGSVLVAKPVRLYFADVPVAWLPFVAQSLSGGSRSSGLLTPRFSVNDIVRTSGGYNRRISNLGFFWAMSDYTDATLAFDWFSDNYVALTGSFRYRWLRQFLNGSMNVRRYWSSSQSSQFALDTQNSWEISERTSFNMSARYATSTSFIRRNSFDPREVTSQIRSQGGLSHRFDWGSLNVSADRAQSLSDDAVTMSLPRLGLTIRPITFLKAPVSRAKWYNNITWSGGMNLARRINDKAARPDSVPFSFGMADVADLNVQAQSAFNVGRFSTSQSLNVTQNSVFDVPSNELPYFPDMLAEQGMQAFSDFRGLQAWGAQTLGEVTPVDIAVTDLSWSLGLDYQQNLVGTTTLTPRLSFSGNARKSDTVSVAQSFVSAPTRVSFGAALKADLYGFYGGIGPYQAIRHKLSPYFTYDWSPESTPDELQQRVFGSRALQPQSVLSVTLNQTWEAKKKPSEGTDTTAAPGRGAGQRVPTDSLGQAVPPEATEPVGIDDSADDAGGPRRLEQGEIVELLAIRTSAIRYDFVQADSTGDFLSGFTTTTLQNQISSDFLYGLTISMSHDLFEQVTPEGGEGGTGGGKASRKFAPHLTSLNFGFSLSPSSTIFRYVPFLGQGEDAGGETSAEDVTADEPYEQRSATDETSVIPGSGTDDDIRQGRAQRAGGGRGGADWSARFSYALNRPRDPGPRGTSQLLQISLNMNPTEHWEASWNTSYDIQSGAFADHRIRLTRDLHRWQANFDFLKTSTGNWSFRFEVSLLDNQDLKFDYQQRNLEDVGARQRF